MVAVGSEATILITAILVAVSCASIGTFLVLRQMAMMSDAISHSVLLGIVIAVFMVGGREVISVIVGGVLVGILTVSLVELLYRTRKLKEDSAIGIVFPALFAIGVILVSQAGNIHIDAQHVLYGAIEFSPFDVLYWDDSNMGPRSFWVLGVLAAANMVFIGLLYKELKISTFDGALAAALGLMPGLIHYLLMVMVATTAVVAFESVGAILVIALFIVPASAAYLLTDKLPHMLGLSIGLGAASAILGYIVAVAADVSIAGSMATFAGVIFGVVWVVAPRRGLISRWYSISKNRFEFDVNILLDRMRKSKIKASSIPAELEWSKKYSKKIVEFSERKGLIKGTEELDITEKGRSRISQFKISR